MKTFLIIIAIASFTGCTWLKEQRDKEPSQTSKCDKQVDRDTDNVEERLSECDRIALEGRFEEKERIVSITTISQDTPAYLLCRYKNATKFEDYVLEFKYKAAQGVAIFFRIKQGEKGMKLGLPPASSFISVQFLIKGISVQIFFNDKLEFESVVDLHTGYFGFVAHKPGTVQIKNLKVTITK